MKTLKIILILCSITLFSCDQNTDTNLINTKLKSFSFDSNTIPIEYDAQNKPIFSGITYNSTGNISRLGAYTYNYNNGKLTTITKDPNSIYSTNEALLTYNTQGKVSVETITFTETSTNITKTFLRNFSYNSSNKLSQIIEERIEINGSTSLVKYEIAYYSDGKIDDIVRYRSLNNGATYLEEEALTHYYDDKKNPFYNLFVDTVANIEPFSFYQHIGVPSISLGYSSNIKLQNYSPNNLIRIERYNAFNQTSTDIASFTYTYNQDDFPISAVKTITQQSGSTYTQDWSWVY